MKENKPLGFFPAGEVSTIKKGEIYYDTDWNESVMKLIQKANLPITPIYFSAKNSRSFYRFARISDKLRTLFLPREVSLQYKREIKLRIGKAITIKEQSEYHDNQLFSEFIKKRTYVLANSIDKNKFKLVIPSKIKLKHTVKEIATKIDVKHIEAEIELCREKGNRLLQTKNYEVF